MKKIFTAALLAFSLATQAQQNSLLTQSFWQAKPDVEAVKAEVTKGNDPAELNPASFDAVVMAINAQAPTAAIKYLLEQPGNTHDKITHDRRHYLHWAANRGNTEIMEYLIGKGANVSFEDSHGTTPLNFAAGSGQQNTKVYDLLIANGANPKKELNQNGANALLLAAASDKDLNLINYFVSKGLDLKSTDAMGYNAFSYAARGGNVEQLKALVKKGVTVNEYALLTAAQGGGRRGGGGEEIGLPFFQYLESLRIKPTVTNKNGENVLHFLVRKPNQAETIKYFLSKGVDVNKADAEGNTALLNAATSNQDTAIIALLLPKVKDINHVNKQGMSALTMAVRTNSLAMARFLASKGADVKVLDQEGNNLAYHLVQAYTPASERSVNAPKKDEFDAKLQLLQAKGLQVKAPQKNGNTLYHVAVVKNDLPLLQRLQPLGIDINHKNAEGITALHKAAMVSKDDAILKYLVSIGAKKEIGTNFDETAFDLASENESLTKNNISVNFLK
ncbi:ankyrin repeat domain-containing protein [Pontibacter qinzhouensis]|uniref:Ankyrin repeat domain-containing protein n=1 Tax=Pontibacter qinzhouensis TaxID=2603253 RepID=A0A5C8J8D4_9BACT|nr:ankyrin repeat domain-containing protein [Pontibacter qinzhouensis]TXK33294.1 ankyrin repeat domain-containing protein [Pontibacter qinzhouensis]